MSLSRRNFLGKGTKLGLAATASTLWSNSASARVLSSFGGSDYKAVVLISLIGGNDGNNTVVPTDNNPWLAYAEIRPTIAIGQNSLIPLYGPSNTPNYGLHPALANVATLYNQRRGLIVANVGPLPKPATKADVLANVSLFPGASCSHTVGAQQCRARKLLRPFLRGGVGV